MSGQLDNPQAPWTIKRLLGWTNDFFRDRDIDEPRLSAEILLANALGCERIFLYTRFDQVPDPAAVATFRDHVQRAGGHEPIAYLVGRKEFFSLDFEVTGDVLIPRPETETLVTHAVDLCRTGPERPTSLLDIGTGSGCIIVTVLAQSPTAVGVATDLSTAALEVARRNAERHGVIERIRFIEADKLSLPRDVVPDGGFDLILSNPPYVAADEMGTLSPCVRDHEPTIALSPGGDGLDFYRAIAAGASPLLHAEGAVLVEIGAGQRDDVAAVFAAGGIRHGHASVAMPPAVFAAGGVWRHVGTYRSPNDPHDRVMHFAKAGADP